MKNDVYVNDTVTIPAHELEISTSRAGGPGGQHVNKSDTRITIRWNAHRTTALNDEQKQLLLQNLHNKLTTEGDLIIHNSESRSQQHNKKSAIATLGREIRAALFVPKKRRATRVSKNIKEKRLQSKAHRSTIKKTRAKIFDE